MKNVTSFLVIFLVLGFLSACGPSSAALSSLKNDEDNQIKQYESLAGFTIVVPKYVPRDAVLGSVLVQGPPIGMTSNMINFSYGSGNKEINISEAHEVSSVKPSLSNYTYIDVNGVQVLEEMFKDLTFIWESEGYYFLVTNHGYSKDECLKVIESMIN